MSTRNGYFLVTVLFTVFGISDRYNSFTRNCFLQERCCSCCADSAGRGAAPDSSRCHRTPRRSSALLGRWFADLQTVLCATSRWTGWPLCDRPPTGTAWDQHSGPRYESCSRLLLLLEFLITLRGRREANTATFNKTNSAKPLTVLFLF